MRAVARVGLIGLQGYGRVHLREVDRLAQLGKVELVACADVKAPSEEAKEILARLGPQRYWDYRELLDKERLDVVIVATPPHLHAPMALGALEAGCHVLLEKPPVVEGADFDALESTARRQQLACQVGFQALGSGVLARLRELAGGDELGVTPRLFATGHWRRDRAYWGRAPWAGRDRVDGRAAHDGALTNPFAHAVMNCCAILGCERTSDVKSVVADRYRANAIEVDDTSVVQVTTAAGRSFSVAVTLCAERSVDPICTLEGASASARWRYRHDRLELVRGNERCREESYARRSLLEELVDLAVGKAVNLSSPLSKTQAFVTILEAISASPVQEVPAARVLVEGSGPAATTVIRGVDALVEQAAREAKTLAQLGLASTR